MTAFKPGTMFYTEDAYNINLYENLDCPAGKSDYVKPESDKKSCNETGEACLTCVKRDLDYGRECPDINNDHYSSGPYGKTCDKCKFASVDRGGFEMCNARKWIKTYDKKYSPDGDIMTVFSRDPDIVMIGDTLYATDLFQKKRIGPYIRILEENQFPNHPIPSPVSEECGNHKDCDTCPYQGQGFDGCIIY